ncbi:MAG: hypothetical protein R2792_01040 [Saprospiraceae bacterium]
MKAFVYALVVVLAFSSLSYLGLPWWIVAFAGFLAGYVLIGRFTVLLGAFSGGLLAWGLAAYFKDRANTGILAERMGEVFGGLGGFELILVTAFLGGLVALAACFFGRSLRILRTGNSI